MRFFTPELFLKLNSADDEVIDRAIDAWDEALDAYRAHRTGIEEKGLLRGTVRDLAYMCLHDAEIVDTDSRPDLVERIRHFGWWGSWRPAPTKLFLLSQNDAVILLVYGLAGSVVNAAPPPGWPDEPDTPTLWLYDEIDVLHPDDVPELFPETKHMWGPSSLLFTGNSNMIRVYCHRVLLSSGAVYVIPFINVTLHHLPDQFLESRYEARC